MLKLSHTTTPSHIPALSEVKDDFSQTVTLSQTY